MNELHDVVSRLKSDPNSEVGEAAYESDFELLKTRKKVALIL
jgi:hypothetical protein